MISRRTSLLALALASIVAACGGNVVVDKGGSTTTTTTTGDTGGTGGTGGIGGTGGTGGVGAADVCGALEEQVKSALDAAQKCNPAISSLQCSGAVTALDTCGCPVAANEKNPQLADHELNVWNQWVGAGCGPYDCFACPPPPTSGWYCDPNKGACTAAWMQ